MKVLFLFSIREKRTMLTVRSNQVDEQKATSTDIHYLKKKKGNNM